MKAITSGAALLAGMALGLAALTTGCSEPADLMVPDGHMTMTFDVSGMS